MVQLIQKLETQGDISLEEADEIYSLFLDPSAKKTKLNYDPFGDDFELIHALEKWYEVVADKIKKRRKGELHLYYTSRRWSPQWIYVSCERSFKKTRKY